MSACSDTRPGSTHASYKAWRNGCCSPASMAARIRYREAADAYARQLARGEIGRSYYQSWDDIDVVSVDAMVINGGNVGTWGERREAVRRLVQNGWTSAQIAEHMGLTTRTVERYRSRLKAAA